ncbi:hypothetical protein JCM15519_14820 [Fundidesulfovibrio butyratiphilus]
MDPLIERMKQDVIAQDFEAFRKDHFVLLSSFRRLIFGQDNVALARRYASLSDFSTWFYRTNKPEWPKVERYMGGIDIMLDLARTKLDTRTSDELAEEVGACQSDRDILGGLLLSDGVVSAKLALELGAPLGEIENRLRCLEEMGLVQRLKRGRTALVFLTPTGRQAAADLA